MVPKISIPTSLRIIELIEQKRSLKFLAKVFEGK